MKVWAMHSKENFVGFLRRNPNLSSIATVDEVLIGALMCGYDGMDGRIYHVAVDFQWRRKGIGTALVSRSLAKLSELNAQRCSLVVRAGNDIGAAFWDSLGWSAWQGEMMCLEIQT